MFTKQEAQELIEVVRYVGDNLGPQVDRLAQEIVDDFLAVETAALAGLKASQVDRLRGLLTGFADGLAELKQS